MQNRSVATPSRLLWTLLALAVAVSLATTGCNKLEARDLLNKGVQDYKANQYDKAVEKFKEAKRLDPSLKTARLYLATAYANQYVPGSPDAANVEHANQAVQEFKEVLDQDPSNLAAIDGIGSLLFNMAAGPPPNFEMMKESRKYHQMHIKYSPNDPTPYYWVGVIDWTLAFKANQQLRQDYNKDVPEKKRIKDIDPLPEKLRADFAAKYSADVDEGIAALKKGIDLRPDYDDAMAYLNLLDRQKADMMESPDERKKLEDEADTLIDKVKEIKQRRESHPPPTS
ncbi:MAG TPA: hypothetical protein VLW54_15270 [Candidatus Acidoferrales bacterium]|nr:hypothetical protein [Candidatus Acidoferrales bacterium]